MTAVTVRFFMRTIEFESGLGIVVKTPDQPAVRCMALLAILAEFATMRVIGFVAVIATGSRILVNGTQMTLFTGYNGMQADQGKLCDVVFEAHLGAPAGFVVAARTVLALLSLVHIIDLVTGQAIGGQPGVVNMLLVAGGTADVLVFAPESEFCPGVMVEALLCPAGFVMAVLTFLAEPALVHVIVLVTGQAIGFDFDLVRVLLVTGGTGKFLMPGA